MQQTVIPGHAEEQIKTTYLKDYQPPHFFIDEINLNFELYDEWTIVTSLMKINRNSAVPKTSNELILNGENLILESIKLNDVVLPDDNLKIFPAYLVIPSVPDSFTLEIITKIFPDKNTALSGLYRSGKSYCTQCEAEGFRRITYFLDHPDILAYYTTTISADAKQYPYLLSNGNLIASGKLEDGRHWVKWNDPFKKPSYLFALVAGDFDILEDHFVTQSNREVKIKIYVEKGLGDQADYAVYALKEAMRWDEKTYGREYDLNIYMIVAISDCNMGAMENKGLNIFNTKYILAKPETATDDDYMHILSVVGHEYFHNWTGNRVTCRDWFQLSLKEGLTIFRDQTFSEDIFSHAVIRIRNVIQLRTVQFPEDAGPLAHPVRPNSYIQINNFYTATVYNKGAEVLRMLQTILGPKLFRKGMDLYFERYDGHAVTIEDYVKTMEDVSDIDLEQFKLWYSQAGTPVVNVVDDYDSNQQIYTLTINQTCPPTPTQPEKEPMFIPIRIGLINQEGGQIPLHLNNEKVDLEKVLLLTKSSQVFQFKQVASRPIPSLLRNFSAPIILNYAYSDADLQFLFKHDKDPFNRWEAGQNYALRICLNLIRDHQQQNSLKLPEEFIEMYRHILQQPIEDKFLLAEMLLIPSEKYIGEQMDTIDVVSIHVVREFVITQIAQHLEDLLHDTYQQNSEKNTHIYFNMEAIGKRQLKNRCLLYLGLLSKNATIVMQQFETALQDNMTDTQAALTALANIDTPYREQAIEQFYNCWQKDALVMDKWFAIQAATKLPIALQQVKKLMRHDAFNLKNPNKVHALIGTFGYRNHVNFHAENGEGYAFLRDTVQQLDKLNPQIAASMIKPLTTWKRYDKDRANLMREQLELILQDKKLSKDLYEVVTKSLEG